MRMQPPTRSPTGHRGPPWKAGSLPQAEAHASGDRKQSENQQHLNASACKGTGTGSGAGVHPAAGSHAVTARILSQGGLRTESQHTHACTPERPRARVRNAPQCSEDSLANHCRLPRGTDTQIKTKKACSVSLTRHRPVRGLPRGLGAAHVLGLLAGGPLRPQGPHSAEQGDRHLLSQSGREAQPQPSLTERDRSTQHCPGASEEWAWLPSSAPGPAGWVTARPADQRHLPSTARPRALRHLLPQAAPPGGHRRAGRQQAGGGRREAAG